jgi:chemotaxis protein methyltransferase CheR
MSHTAKTLPPLSDGAYARFRDLIIRRTGMLFGERRRDALNRALAEGAQRMDSDVAAYYVRLEETPTNSDLWDDLIKALTINETYFFRDPQQIEALRRHLLPDLIARHGADRTLRLWSAGCSTGEEPYTLAILLRQLLPDISHWKILILATDLNKQALETAGRAHYRAWSFRQTESALRQAYFTPQGDGFVLAPTIQRMVTFAYLNLADSSYPSNANHTADIDLILCRNVTIYLPSTIIREVAHRFHQCLAPGGWLMVGPSETDDTLYRQFQVLKFANTIVYQKAAAGSPPPAPRPPIPHVESSPELVSQPLLPKSVWPTPAATPDLPPMPPPWLPLTPMRALPGEPSPTAEPIQLFERGARLSDERQYDEARQCFLDFLNQKPDDVATLYQLARLEANAGRLVEGQHWAERALEQNPLHPEAHFTLAQIHQELGELDQAIGRYKKALYLNPGFILAHVNLSNLYQKAGQTTEAARHRGQALRLAAKLPPETVLHGSDDVTAGHLASTDRQP